MKERALDAPIFTKQRAKTKKDDATEYKKRKHAKQQRLFFLVIPLRSPRPFRIGPFQTLLVVVVVLFYSRSSSSNNNNNIKSQNERHICVMCRFDE